MQQYFLQWLNNLGIKDKLLVFIAIPLVSIFLLSFLGITDKYQQYMDNKNTQKFLSIVSGLDGLIYELQKERGISTSLITTRKNTVSQKNIFSQRQSTDKALHRFYQLTKNLNIAFMNWQLREEFFSLNHHLEELTQIRARIDAKDFDSLIQNYSDLNSHAINFTEYLQLLTKDTELAKLSEAYIDLLWLQERAGQERATLAWVFVSGVLNPDYYRQVIAHIESQKNLIRNYNLKAPSEYRKFLQHALSHPVNKEVAKIRDAAINKVIRNELLNELQSLIGYGGLIHDFTKYLIRSSPSYLENFKNGQKKAKELIKRYKDSPGITQEDLLHLNAIEDTFENYSQSIVKAVRLKEAGASLQEIDNAVQVEDTQALKAITYLRNGITEQDFSFWWRNSTQRIDLIKEMNDRLILDVSNRAANNTFSAIISLCVYLSIMAFTLIVSFILGTFLMRRLIVELKNISSYMKKMSLENRFDQPLTVSGNDEISEMAVTFNQLIQEHLKFESELRLSAEVFASATEAIMIADANKQIQMVNPAFEEISGYNEELVLKKDCLIFKANEMHGITSCQIWAQLRESCRWEGEIWSKKPNGEKYLIWLKLNVIRNSDGVITHYTGMFTDITQRKQYEQNIWKQANYDALTNLPNRNMCMERLSHDLKNATRQTTQVAVLFIDLDRFKLINDTLGHSAGDDLLVEIATRLRNTIRNSDTVSRLGGDEFVITLSDIKELADIEHISLKILETISKPIILRDHSETFTAGSIGIALFPRDGKDVETLMKHADTAMYQSKKVGGNNFMFYREEMNLMVMRHMAIEKELRKALSSRELCLYYQPIVDLQTGSVLGAEALIRWHHPGRGLVGPETFIPVAEDSGLIVPISDWIINTAIQQAIEWNKTSNQILKIAVNISSRQCLDNEHGVVQTLKQAINKPQIKPGIFDIEITENLLMKDVPATIDSLDQIRDLGIGISLDDFGTGYSSLSHLKHFPISTIKIDRTFIKDVTTNEKDAQLVQAIIMLSKGLNLNVIGEGIEKAEHYTFLKNLGCHAGQGFYFKRPLTAKGFEIYLRQSGVLPVLTQENTTENTQSNELCKILPHQHKTLSIRHVQDLPSPVKDRRIGSA